MELALRRAPPYRTSINLEESVDKEFRSAFGNGRGFCRRLKIQLQSPMRLPDAGLKARSTRSHQGSSRIASDTASYQGTGFSRADPHSSG